MTNKPKQAVIIAGGKGTRLKPFTNDNPKAMYPVNNTPFIEKLILQIKSFGITEILILLGYLPEKIIDYLQDGKKYGVNITYDIAPVEFDTGERLIHAKKLLKNTFMFMYCDNYCPINFDKLVSNYYMHKAFIELSAYTNKDSYTKNNVYIKDGKVLIYDKSHSNSKLQGVEIGYAIANKKILDYLDDQHKNLSSIFQLLADNNKLFATQTDHRYYSIGSYDRMKLTEEFFKDKKVVFLDRDGTLNVRPLKACYIEKKEEFIWLDGAKEALKLLKANDYVLVLITNQPGIARGNLSEKDLNSIHNKMQSDLKKINAEIDYIYYCPHNWDEGCECRKPEPGMLYQAQKDLSIDLSKCILFGDDERDIEAANNANCPSILVSNEYPLLSAVKDFLERKMPNDSI